MAEYQTVSHHQHYAQNNQSFMDPEVMLKGLLDFKAQKCQCSHSKQQQQYDHHNLSALETTIQQLQYKIDSMNHQVIEVEGLLTQRDHLYNQLDNLRAQRQQIEEQLEQQEIEEQTMFKKIKGSKGLREMNQRLRRRIKQVRQYIQKMQDQNQKIEDNMGNDMHRTFYSQKRTKQPNPAWQTTNYELYSDYYSPSHRVDKTSSSKLNHEYFEGLRKRLHQRQQEAWSKIRQQEQMIENRNARSMINFGRGRLGATNYTKIGPQYPRNENITRTNYARNATNLGYSYY